MGTPYSKPVLVVLAHGVGTAAKSRIASATAAAAEVMRAIILADLGPSLPSL
jgi:hypothetical protein